jgi:RHS repeat-associated protein
VGGAVTTYTLDLYGGLTQVLGDGASVYLYGLGRIGEEGAAGWLYHLGDALGSVRQLAAGDGEVVLDRSYRPYGGVLEGGGSGASAYGFAGEWTDGTGLVFLRARYMDPRVGRFLTEDPWNGNVRTPPTLHDYNYALNNPLNHTDSTGQVVCIDGNCEWAINPATGDLVWQGLGVPPQPFPLSPGALLLWARLHRMHLWAQYTLLTPGRWYVQSRRDDFLALLDSSCSVHPALLAAAVIHQGNDPKDRPFGTNWVERLYLLIKPNASVGIGQIRRSEYEDYLGLEIEGNEIMLVPATSIIAMTLKLQAASDKIEELGGLPPTERFMLLAYAQNVGSEEQLYKMIEFFFAEDMSWKTLFDQYENARLNLQYVLIHLEWLVYNEGWPVPEGVDLNYWRSIAFEKHGMLGVHK